MAKVEEQWSNAKEKFLRDRVEVYLSKNKRYGDSYLNKLEEHGIVTFKIVGGFKVDRIKNMIAQGITDEDESVLDSVLDLFNYSAITLSWQSRHNELFYIMDCMMRLMYLDCKVFKDFLKENELVTEEEAEVIHKILLKYIGE